MNNQDFIHYIEVIRKMVNRMDASVMFAELSAPAQKDLKTAINHLKIDIEEDMEKLYLILTQMEGANNE